MPRVIHFEVAVDDAERALRFYAEAFGWDARRWDGAEDYWLVTTGDAARPGINGGLYKRHEGMNFSTHVTTLDVPDVEESVVKIEAAGGRRVTPKITIPGVGYFSYCQDTEGNTFGIMQEDAAAK